MVQEIKIHTSYITLGQFLKFCNVISNGGQEKVYLQENKVLVNGELEQRRGRKLFQGDLIKISSITYKICTSQD